MGTKTVRALALAAAALALATTAALAGGGDARVAAADGGIARGNVEIARYMETNWDAETARGVPYPARSPFLVLHGSWHAMGVQYGEGAGEYVRIVYDALYANWRRSGLDPAKLPRVLDMYARETKKLSPELLQFMRGIAKGAAPELGTATHAQALDDYHKILFLNSLFEVVIPPAWRHVAELMDSKKPPETDARFEPFASHSWAAFGSATTHGGGIAGGTRDQPWWPLFYSVSYVAIPTDPSANVTFGNTIAGMIAASAQVNDRGVYIGNTIIGGAEQEFGVPALLVTAYTSFFADSAREAADLFTIGTEAYRRVTGRKTLAYTVGFNQLVADADEALAVERTGRRYAVRASGDEGELGPYVVLTNHHLAGWSHDENGVRTDEPMSDFGSGGGTNTESRYRALYWEIAYNLGAVDLEFGTERLAKLKHSYTEAGELVTEQNGIPIWRLGLTPERYTGIADPADPDAFPTGGNLMYLVADLRSLDVYYTQGIPSHWRGPWDHVWLGDPAYRLLRRSGGAPRR